MNQALSDIDAFDLFIDLSSSGLGPDDIAAHLDRLCARSGLVAEGRIVTVALPASCRPANFPNASITYCAQDGAVGAALAAAASRKRALAVIEDAWFPQDEVVAALISLQRLDPMIGAVQPRFASPDDDRVVGLPSEGPTVIRLPRAALAFLPDTLITPELPAALLVLTSQAVLAAQPPANVPLSSKLGSVLVSLRRRGFRNIVANRVVALFPLAAKFAYRTPELPPSDESDRRVVGELLQSRNHLAALPERALEALLANGFTADGRARVLLDCRGMTNLHNGTSRAILGYLQGFDALQPSGLEITVLASTAAASFHDVKRRFPRFRLRLDHLDGSYVAAVLLNQPWSVDTMIDLHARALFIVFNMFDTISWDVIYPGPEGLDETWRLMARMADGLLFISDFTRQRFAFRFQPDPMIPQVVTHLSVAPDEVACGPVAKAPVGEPYLLVFGNDYDHKGVGPTLTTLAEAFPFMPIFAIGIDGGATPNITALRSGELEEREVDALVAHATAIVFPSHYEGFGLPVVHGLARGRAVIVRQSTLWDEIVGLSRLPGRIVPFHDEASLVRAVGQVVHGLTADTVECGGALDQEGVPPSWRECAKRIADLLRRLMNRDGRRWIERQPLFRRLAEARDK